MRDILAAIRGTFGRVNNYVQASETVTEQTSRSGRLAGEARTSVTKNRVQNQVG